jgi:hypothetical protein
VLGQKGNHLTWGKPTRSGPIDLQTFSLQQVKLIQLWADDQLVDSGNLPAKGQKVAIEFQLQDTNTPVRVPFTDLSLAAQWTEVLCKDWQNLRAREV